MDAYGFGPDADLAAVHCGESALGGEAEDTLGHGVRVVEDGVGLAAGDQGAVRVVIAVSKGLDRKSVV